MPVQCVMFIMHVAGDDKPCLGDLLIMRCKTGDGSTFQFRLMDQLKPNFTRVAIALGFQQYDIATMEKKDDPMYHLLSQWLQGASQDEDKRPLTWATLIAAIRDAGVHEVANVLENYFVEHVHSTEGECVCFAKLPVWQIQHLYIVSLLLCAQSSTCILLEMTQVRMKSNFEKKKSLGD